MIGKIIGAYAGDKLAKEITDKTAELLALLCINMIHISGPSRIVFAGGMIAGILARNGFDREAEGAARRMNPVRLSGDFVMVSAGGAGAVSRRWTY